MGRDYDQGEGHELNKIRGTFFEKLYSNLFGCGIFRYL